jgi:hypothetical protein
MNREMEEWYVDDILDEGYAMKGGRIRWTKRRVDIYGMDG